MQPQDDKNQNAQSEETNEPQQVDVPRRNPMRWLVIIIIVLALILAGLIGWFWWQDRNSTEEETPNTAPPVSSEEEAAAEKTCEEEGFAAYTNEELGIAFCYPEAWGAAAVADAKFAPADEGQRWRVSFANKTQVNAGLATEDWSTAAARELTCVDPAVRTLPPFSPLSTEWTVGQEIDTAPPQPSSASRGIEVQEGEYLITEHVDDLLTNGACITGYKIIASPMYPFVATSYFSGFVDGTSVQTHMDNPEMLIPANDRADFAAFLKSIEYVGE